MAAASGGKRERVQCEQARDLRLGRALPEAKKRKGAGNFRVGRIGSERQGLQAQCFLDAAAAQERRARGVAQVSRACGVEIELGERVAWR